MVEDPRSVRLRKWLAHGFLIVFLSIILFPFLMIVSISLRTGNFSTGSLNPSQPTLGHWYMAFGLEYTRDDGTVVPPRFPVLLWMWNSIKVGMVAATGVLFLSTIAAFGFSRPKFRGRLALLDSLLLIQMFPTTLALVAIYAIFDSLGDATPVLGIDSHWALVLVYLSALTLHIWTIKGYFDNLDPALDEAVIIDGATPWQSFRHVLLPLAVPILAVVFVLAFIGFVNDYPDRVDPDTLRDEDDPAVGSRLYLNDFQFFWGDFAAAAILSGLPITVVFLIAQRYLVSGLSEGGVKG